MKVFILDDTEERQATLTVLLRAILGNPTIFAARSRGEAEEILSHEKEFGLMFLDHDLGGRVYVDSKDYNTGWWVAKYISENGIKSDQIIVHTLNYSGAQNMLSVLPEADYIPFISLVERLKSYAGEIH